MNKITDRTIKQINSERRKFLDMLSKAGVSAGVLRASTIAGGMMFNRFAEAATNDKSSFCCFTPTVLHAVTPAVLR